MGYLIASEYAHFQGTENSFSSALWSPGSNQDTCMREAQSCKTLPFAPGQVYILYCNVTHVIFVLCTHSPLSSKSILSLLRVQHPNHPLHPHPHSILSLPPMSNLSLPPGSCPTITETKKLTEETQTTMRVTMQKWQVSQRGLNLMIFILLLILIVLLYHGISTCM